MRRIAWLLALCCAGVAGEELQLVPLAPPGGFAGGEGNVYPPGWTLAPLRKVSIASQYGNVLCLKQDGTVVGWGTYGRGGTYPPPEGPALDIGSGPFYQAAVMADGSVRVWGWSSTVPNPSSPPALSDAIAVAMDSHAAYALRAGGSVVSWPSSILPPANNGFTSIRATHGRPLGLRGGALVAWGGWQTTYPPPAGGVLGADADISSAVAILADGSAFRWAGSGPVLPAGPWSDVVVSSDTSLLRRPDGRVVEHSYMRNAERAGSAGSLSMDTDGSLSAVVRADGSLDLWHETNPLPAGPKGIGRVVDAVLANGSYGGGLALLDDGSLLSWGGVTWNAPAGGGFVSIAASNQAGYAVHGDGTVHYFGYNGHSGAYPTDAVLVQASYSHAAVLRRTGQVEMFSTTVGYSGTATALAGSVALATGDGWTLGLKSDGSVAGWGPDDSLAVRNIPGDLGEIAQLAGYGDYALVRRTDGTLRAWGALASVPPGITDAVDVAACSGAFAVLRADGTVLVWEKPGRLRTVQPATTDRVRKLCGGPHPIALRTPAPLLRGHPASGSAATVTIPARWNWPVTGFAADDVVVGNGTVVAVTGSGDTYDIVVRPAAAGTVTVEVRRGAAVNALGWPSMEARTVYRALPLTASPLAIGVPEGQTTTITVPNPNAPVPVSAELVAAPLHGTLGAFSGASAGYTPQAGYVGSDSFAYRLGNGSYWSDPATVTLTVRLINLAPTLAQPSDAVLREDGASLSLPLSGIGPGRALESGQTLSITTASSASGIVPPPAVVYASPAATGSLTISPVANAYGSADITVIVRDDGGTLDGGVDEVRRTFRVDVQPVNDPPTLAFIPGFTVVEDAAEQSWTLTGIGPGPANEAVQVLTGQAFSTAPAVVNHPTLDFAGGGTATLRWRPQPDAHGTARIYVTFLDDGGTADGGADSVSQSFTVTITPVNDPPTATTADWQVNPGTSNYLPATHLAIADVDAPPPATLVATITDLPLPGTLSVRGAAATVGGTFTMQDVLDHEVIYQAPASEETTSLSFTIGDGAVGGLGPHHLAIRVTGLISNLPPVLGLSGVAQWQEALPPVAVDPNATVEDTDSPDFDGGEVRAAITLNGSGEDVLSVHPVGGVSLDGVEVQVEGVVVGSVSGGSGGASLVVNLNANATPARVERVVRAVSFAVASTKPSDAQRTVQVTVRDGDPPGVAARTAQVQVVPMNSPPTVGFPRLATVVAEGAAAAWADDSAVCTDLDSDDFAGGSLTIAFVSGTDGGEFLAFADHAPIAVAGGSLSHGGSDLGTWMAIDHDGDPATPAALSVTLAATATPAQVQDLLRALTVRCLGDDPRPGTRVLRATLADGDGGSGHADLAVVIAPINDAPTLALSAGTVVWRQGEAPRLVDDGAAVGDADSPELAGGRLTAWISVGASASDRLMLRDAGAITVVAGEVRHGGSAIGTVSGGDSGASPLVVALNAAATPTRVQDLLRALAFASAATVPTAQDRTVAVAVEDGDGGTSLTASRIVQVVLVNLPPRAAFAGGAAAYAEDAPAIVLDAGATVEDDDSADFAGGSLTIAAGHADDRLAIGGTGLGGIMVAGAVVTWGGEEIGTWSGGEGTVPLVVVLNAAATPARVQDLLRAVLYRSVAQAPPATTTVSLVVNDGDGGVSATVQRTVAITPENDPPGGAPKVLTVAGQAATGRWSATDPEGDAVTWSVVAQPGGGSLQFDDAATGAWRFVPDGTPAGPAIVRVVDAHGADSGPLAVPVLVTGPADPRPVPASDPPPSVQVGQTWTWDLLVAGDDIAASPDLEYEAIDAPPGLTATPAGPRRATVAWAVPVDAGAGGSVRFLLRISDRASGRSALVPVLIHLRAAIAGGG